MISRDRVETITIPTRAGEHPLLVVPIFGDIILLAVEAYEAPNRKPGDRKFIREGAILVYNWRMDMYHHCETIDTALAATSHAMMDEDDEYRTRMPRAREAVQNLALQSLLAEKSKRDVAQNTEWRQLIRALIREVGPQPEIEEKRDAIIHALRIEDGLDSLGRRNHGVVQARLEATRRRLTARTKMALAIHGRLGLRHKRLLAMRTEIERFEDALEVQVELWRRGIVSPERPFTSGDIKKYRRQMQGVVKMLERIIVLPTRHMARRSISDLKRVMKVLPKASRPRTKTYIDERLVAILVAIDLQRSGRWIETLRTAVAANRRFKGDNFAEDLAIPVCRLRLWLGRKNQRHGRVLRNNVLFKLSALALRLEMLLKMQAWEQGARKTLHDMNALI